jgi:hypothetical protein
MRSSKVMRIRRDPRLVWLALALVALGGGCEDVGDRVVVKLSMGFSPSAELDEVEVIIAASATDQGDQLCAPYSKIFVVDSADATDTETTSFPLRIEVRPGQTYDRILYVRVRGWQDGTLRIKTERMVSLQGGDVLLEILLPADCLGIGTGAGQHCVGGLTMESPYGPIFDDNLYVEPGAPSCVVE